MEIRLRWLDRLEWSDVWVPGILLPFTALGVRFLIEGDPALGVMLLVLMGLPCAAMLLALLRTLLNATVVELTETALASTDRPIALRRRVRVQREGVRRVWAVTDRLRGAKGRVSYRHYVWVQVEGAAPVLLAPMLPNGKMAEHLAALLCAALDLPEEAKR